jgi:serine/threonine protein kinase/tetratricopeptide (TPR) repeat protein
MSSALDAPRGQNGSLDAARSEIDDPRLLDALEEYAAAVDAGRRPDRREFLARHQDVAAALAECIEGLEIVHSAARQVNPALAGGSSEPGSPSCLGDYRLLREVGRGGMGVVYEAEQISLGRRVAVKVLPFAASLDRKQLARFQVEAQAAASLNHPHIVPIFAVGCDLGAHFYAMQFVDGRSLADVVAAKRGPGSNGNRAPEAESRVTPDLLSARSVAALGVQAAGALEHAHGLGVLHRDVKPANLLVDPRGHLWVTDFGLARLQDSGNLTQTGDLLGTLRYMSPEQARADRVLDPRADVYSLGVTLYELLTLIPAFECSEREELLRKITLEDPVLPRKIDPSIPRDLETIVLKAMSKEPEARYASALALADDLQRFLDDRPILARRPGPRERIGRWARRHKTAVATAAVVLILTVVGMTTSSILLWRGESRTKAHLQLALKALDDFALSTSEMDFTRDPELAQEIEKLQLNALGLYEGLNRQNPTDPEARWGTARAYHRVGNIRAGMSQLAEAEAAYSAADRLLEELATTEPGKPRYRAEQAKVLGQWGMFLVQMGRSANGAERILRRSVDTYRRLAAEYAPAPVYLESLAQAYVNLSESLDGDDKSRLQEKERLLRDALKLRQRIPGNAPAQREESLADIHGRLSELFYATGRRPLAEQEIHEAVALTEALEAQFPDDAKRRSTIASLYSRLCPRLTRPMTQSERRTAEESYRRAVSVWRRLAADFPGVAEYRQGVFQAQLALCQFLAYASRPREAEAALREGIDVLQGLLRDHPKVARFRNSLSYAHVTLGDMLNQSDRAGEALAALERAVELGAEHRASENALAWFLVTTADTSLRDPARGVMLARRAIAASPQTSAFWNTLGVALVRTGDYPGAQGALESSMRLNSGGDAYDWFPMAIIRWHQGDPANAHRWYDRAADSVSRAKRRYDDLLRLQTEAASTLGWPLSQQRSEGPRA